MSKRFYGTMLVLGLVMLALLCSKAHAGNKSPWTSTIQENYQLTECKETERRMQFAMKVHDVLIKNMNEKVTDEGIKQVMIVQIRALYEYVYELQTWMSDNCEEA